MFVSRRSPVLLSALVLIAQSIRAEYQGEQEQTGDEVKTEEEPSKVGPGTAADVEPTGEGAGGTGEGGLNPGQGQDKPGEEQVKSRARDQQEAALRTGTANVAGRGRYPRAGADAVSEAASPELKNTGMGGPALENPEALQTVRETTVYEEEEEE